MDPSHGLTAPEHKPRFLILGNSVVTCQLLSGIFEQQDYDVRYINDVQALTSLDVACGSEPGTVPASPAAETPVADVVIVCGEDDFVKAGASYCERLKTETQAYIPLVLICEVDQVEPLMQRTGLQPDAIVAQPCYPYVLMAQIASMLRIKREHDVLCGAIRLREDLTNMIAHDLRTPLTVITLYSAGVRRLLKQLHGSMDAPTVSKIHERIQTITDNVNAMEALIADMLTIARTEADRITLRRSWVNINDLIVTASHPQREIAHGKGLDLNLTLLETDIDVYIDRDLMRRVLDNLLANAVKFSPENSRVDVKVHYVTNYESERDHIRVAISDQGPGIDEAFQEHIFNRWGIAELKRQGVVQIGLGLAFCKLAVEAHNGKISVDSRPGQGSTFSFSLPL